MDIADVGDIVTGKDPRQRRLTGPDRTHDGDGVPTEDRQRNAVDGPTFIVPQYRSGAAKVLGEIRQTLAQSLTQVGDHLLRHAVGFENRSGLEVDDRGVVGRLRRRRGAEFIESRAQRILVASSPVQFGLTLGQLCLGGPQCGAGLTLFARRRVAGHHIVAGGAGTFAQTLGIVAGGTGQIQVAAGASVRIRERLTLAKLACCIHFRHVCCPARAEPPSLTRKAR